MSDETTHFSHQDLNRTIHERTRLGIMTILAAREKPIVFSELMSLAQLTNGNLSRHLSNLESEGIIAIEKSFDGKRPKTEIYLTQSGRDAYFEYIDQIEALVLEAKKAKSLKLKPS